MKKGRSTDITTPHEGCHERVRCKLRRFVQGIDPHGPDEEKQNDGEGPYESELLAYGGEDIVRMGCWKVVELLQPLPIPTP